MFWFCINIEQNLLKALSLVVEGLYYVHDNNEECSLFECTQKHTKINRLSFDDGKHSPNPHTECFGFALTLNL